MRPPFCISQREKWRSPRHVPGRFLLDLKLRIWGNARWIIRCLSRRGPVAGEEISSAGVTSAAAGVDVAALADWLKRAAEQEPTLSRNWKPLPFKVWNVSATLAVVIEPTANPLRYS